eukprot:XP_019080934.1 PREDICTED: uncharacterized protein LOC100245166 isoform X3 [Vitis vinifera]
MAKWWCLLATRPTQLLALVERSSPTFPKKKPSSLFCSQRGVYIKEEMISVFVAHNKAMARLIGLLVFIGFVGALVYFNVFTHQLAHAQLQIRARPRRILMDTDVDMDDFFSLFYLLKENTSEFNLEAITLSANGWCDSGHGINHIYDLLFMMGRDDIPVGVGGEGGILPNGTILPDVGGYLPIIDQGTSTAGGCRYRQAIPMGAKGLLDIDTMYGLRKGFLPQGSRGYSPLEQPTAQQVMINAVSAGPITVFLLGDDNPYAEFNFFEDPFAAYEVLHSGIPVTLIPLDATNTIPITENFFKAFEQKQNTYEAQYSFKAMKMAHDTWFNNHFHENVFMWDYFMVGVALSIMRNSANDNGENEFAVMEYTNITVVTSNEPYGISDGSNPFNDGSTTSKFKNGVHSGHVQTGNRDPFCLEKNQKGRCKDGYTMEVTGPDSVRVLVATEAKRNQDANSLLDREFYKSFLDVISRPQQSGRFNISTQFPYYGEIVYKPDFGTRKKGKPFVFDMDMSTGDLIALLYLLKLPVEQIDLKGILVSPNGWASAATIDIVYDVLHMMGRDDIPVGLGDVFAIGQKEQTFPLFGDCKYRKAIPLGGGGLLDSDTLYGFARDLPRSPRRYTAENSVKFGAPRDTDHPEVRQPLALEVWKSIVDSTDPGSKITYLTNGPLTNLAQVISSERASSVIQDLCIVGGHIDNKTGNLFTVPSNEFAEFNMFLDPLAVKVVMDSKLNVTLIPLGVQRSVSSFNHVLQRLEHKNQTPEAAFTQNLLSRLSQLQQKSDRYHHMDTFLGEILGAVVLAGDDPLLNQAFQHMPLKILANGDVKNDGQIVIDEKQGRLVKVLRSVNTTEYYDHFADVLNNQSQSARIGNFAEQKRIWTTPPNRFL